MLRSSSRAEARVRAFAHRIGLGRRARLVLTYHRVADIAFDPFALAVPPDWFAGHLAVLRRRAEIVPVADLLGPVGRGRRPRVAVTFDDGYRDTLDVAVPILRDAEVPATVFVSTGYLGDVRGYWWDRVASAIGASDVPAAALDGIVPPAVAALGSPGGPGTAAAVALALAERIRAEPPDARDALVDQVEARLPARVGGHRALAPILDEAGVRTLAATPGMTIGAHTDRHAQLAALPSADQMTEIVRGLDRLEGILGARPDLLAYPYGGEGDYDGASCAAAAAAGLRVAFVNHHRRFDLAADPFRLPRWAVPPVAPEAFAPWLDRALAA